MTDRNPFHALTNRRSMISLLGVQAVVIFILVGALLAGLPGLRVENATATLTPPSATHTINPTLTPSPTVEIPTPTLTATPEPLVQTNSEVTGWMALSMNDGGYAHLFAYHPQLLPFTRLTDHPWDDITPAISPDGTIIAYSSRQNGYWDLYLLDLRTGTQTRLTDTAEYDAAPTWSPDGMWLAYETYVENNLELFILSATDPAQPPLRLTDDPSADRSPAWAPDGRHIAFVSDRSGEDEVWVADLDEAGDRFTNLSLDSARLQSHPAWSADGASLAWVSNEGRYTFIERWDASHPQAAPIRVGEGDWPAWDHAGQVVGTRLQEPNSSYLAAYTSEDSLLAIPPVDLPGEIYGWDWTEAALPTPLPASLDTIARLTPTPLWDEVISGSAENPTDRQQIVPLEGVVAPHAYLLDQVTGSFQALRSRIVRETGWDLLAALEDAYIPVTDALPPGFDQDWAYTGRSFAFNPTSLEAGWVVVVQEYYGGKVYWRVYVRAYYQDGSQGMPLDRRTWDLNARYSGDPIVYDQGGKLSAAVPSGYWIDLTDLARRYGWERVPALSSWRTYFPGTRFNRFIQTDQLDWETAMLDLYPPEALSTPTPIVPPTSTPTRAPAWYKSPTPSLTPIPSVTPTRRATWTPIP